MDLTLLTNRELLDLPDPEWLIRGLIPLESRVGLYGAYSTAKSFLALDWALCVATGRAWQGHEVQQGPVIYIASEGGGGIKKRVQAWMAANGVEEISAIYYFLQPLYIRDHDTLEEFLTQLDDMFPEEGYVDETGQWSPGGLWPRMIVIDTLSASFGGGEENNSEDMGSFMGGVIEIGRERKTTVLIVHHSNAIGSKARGHTSFGCNVDVLFKSEAKVVDGKIEGAVTIVNEKQKDSEAHEKIYLQPEHVSDSLVLVPGCPPDAPNADPRPKYPDIQSMRVALRVAENGLTWSEWRLATSLPKHIFGKRLRRLLKDGEIYKDNNRYYFMGALEDYAELDEESEPSEVPDA